MRRCAYCKQAICVFYRIPGRGITTEEEVLCVGCIETWRNDQVFDAAEAMWDRWKVGKAA